MSTSVLADPLYERLLRSFPADRAYVPDDWNTSAMPDPVRHYLEHLLRHHSQREARHLHRARTDWVNYDHPEMEQAVRGFFSKIEEHVQVPEDEWASTLRTATRRTVSHLAEPIATLRTFVFDDRTDVIPAAQVLWRMRFFGPYSYLCERVEAEVESSEGEGFTPEAFERTLSQIDDDVTGGFDAGQWLDLLKPLFAMTDRATDRNEAPIPLLRTFFEEKEEPDILEELARFERAENASAVSPGRLRRLIEAASGPPSPDETAEEPPAFESEPGADLRSMAEAARAPAEGEQAADDAPTTGDDGADQPTPLWKQFQQGRTRRSGDVESQESGGSEPLWTQFQHSRSAQADTSPSKPSSAPSSSDASPSGSTDSSTHASELTPLEQDVFGMGPSSHRDVYVRELFQGDEDAYREVLERLQSTESWSVASQIIARDIFRENQVNIYSDAAVHFTNAVETTLRE